MAWAKEEIGRAVGLPPEIGGIPLDTIGATGFGLGASVYVAKAFCNLTLSGARVAVQGFGAVGKHAARFLAEKGAILVAASDSAGTLADPNGIDVARLIAHKNAGRNVIEFAAGEKFGTDAIIDVIGNAGGVICAAVEYHGGTQPLAFATIDERIRANTRQVLEDAVKTGQRPREAAVNLARRRVQRAMTYRRG